MRVSVLLPVGTDHMRSWDRSKPSTSWTSPRTLAQIASVPDRPWRNVGKNRPMQRHHHDRCDQSQPSAIKLSGYHEFSLETTVTNMALFTLLLMT